MNGDEQQLYDLRREFGEYLKTQRERKHISIAAVSKTIRVAEVNLMAIENGDFSKLPRRPFLLGIMKSYGRVLGCDSDELYQKVNDLFPVGQSSVALNKLGYPMDPNLVDVEKPAFYLTRRLMLSLAGVVVVAIGIWIALDFFAPRISGYVDSLRQPAQKGTERRISPPDTEVPVRGSQFQPPTTEEKNPKPSEGDQGSVQERHETIPAVGALAVGVTAYQVELSSLSPNVVKVVTLDETQHQEQTERIVINHGDAVTVNIQGTSGKLWALRPQDLKISINHALYQPTWDHDQVTALATP